MRISLSNGGPFMRRLSVQPEEDSSLDDNTDNDDVPLEPVRPGSGSSSLNGEMPLTFPPISPVEHEANYWEDDMEIIDLNELRKLSVASTSSVKSHFSLSSTCSAPGGFGFNTSIPGNEDCPRTFSNIGDTYRLDSLPKRKMMTSRPSFISLCSIVSETSESPAVARHLFPAPLQVELDFDQRSGVEGDEPTCRSHLPVLRCPSDYDINEMGDWLIGQPRVRKSSKMGLVNGIKQFPKRMRKLSTEKNRFDIYSISDETREQLKRLYVY